MKEILVVEDHTMLRELWVEAVQNAGFAAVGAVSAADAFERLRHHARPDLILLDLVMPSMQMNGIELLARLHENPDWAHIPIVVISGIGDSVDREEAARLGVRRILSKPVNVDTMIAEIRQVMGIGDPLP